MSQVVNDLSLKWIAEHWSGVAAAPDRPAFAFLGIPFDHAVSHRPGTRFGPAGILAALDGCSLYCTDKRVSFERTIFTNLGTVEVFNRLADTYRNIRAAAAAVPAGYTPVFLGGDHSISDPLFRGMQDRLGRQDLGLIVFDSHFDSREPVPGKEHSGHWMKTLEDVLHAPAAVQLGIDAPIYSARYMEEAETKGILVRTPYEIRRKGWPAVVAEAVAHASAPGGGVYLSIDIDAINVAFAPGTSVPNAQGFLAHEVLDAVFEISAATRVVGMDLVEVSPPLDTGDRTSQLAAQIIFNFIAGTVVRHGREGR